jgi:hypothetical protein
MFDMFQIVERYIIQIMFTTLVIVMCGLIRYVLILCIRTILSLFKSTMIAFILIDRLE